MIIIWISYHAFICFNRLIKFARIYDTYPSPIKFGISRIGSDFYYVIVRKNGSVIIFVNVKILVLLFFITYTEIGSTIKK